MSSSSDLGFSSPELSLSLPAELPWEILSTEGGTMLRRRWRALWNLSTYETKTKHVLNVCNMLTATTRIWKIFLLTLRCNTIAQRITRNIYSKMSSFISLKKKRYVWGTDLNSLTKIRLHFFSSTTCIIFLIKAPFWNNWCSQFQIAPAIFLLLNCKHFYAGDTVKLELWTFNV